MSALRSPAVEPVAQSHRSGLKKKKRLLAIASMPPWSASDTETCVLVLATIANLHRGADETGPEEEEGRGLRNARDVLNGRMVADVRNTL